MHAACTSCHKCMLEWNLLVTASAHVKFFVLNRSAHSHFVKINPSASLLHFMASYHVNDSINGFSLSYLTSSKYFSSSSAGDLPRLQNHYKSECGRNRTDLFNSMQMANILGLWILTCKSLFYVWHRWIQLSMPCYRMIASSLSTQDHRKCIIPFYKSWIIDLEFLISTYPKLIEHTFQNKGEG